MIFYTNKNKVESFQFGFGLHLLSASKSKFSLEKTELFTSISGKLSILSML